jgi:hypothetical protein
MTENITLNIVHRITGNYALFERLSAVGKPKKEAELSFGLNPNAPVHITCDQSSPSLNLRLMAYLPDYQLRYPDLARLLAAARAEIKNYPWYRTHSAMQSPAESVTAPVCAGLIRDALRQRD